MYLVANGRVSKLAGVGDSVSHEQVMLSSGVADRCVLRPGPLTPRCSDTQVCLIPGGTGNSNCSQWAPAVTCSCGVTVQTSRGEVNASVNLGANVDIHGDRTAWCQRLDAVEWPQISTFGGLAAHPEWGCQKPSLSYHDVPAMAVNNRHRMANGLQPFCIMPLIPKASMDCVVLQDGRVMLGSKITWVHVLYYADASRKTHSRVIQSSSSQSAGLRKTHLRGRVNHRDTHNQTSHIDLRAHALPQKDRVVHRIKAFTSDKNVERKHIEMAGNVVFIMAGAVSLLAFLLWSLVSWAQRNLKDDFLDSSSSEDSSGSGSSASLTRGDSNESENLGTSDVINIVVTPAEASADEHTSDAALRQARDVNLLGGERGLSPRRGRSPNPSPQAPEVLAPPANPSASSGGAAVGGEKKEKKKRSRSRPRTPPRDGSEPRDSIEVEKARKEKKEKNEKKEKRQRSRSRPQTPPRYLIDAEAARAGAMTPKGPLDTNAAYAAGARTPTGARTPIGARTPEGSPNGPRQLLTDTEQARAAGARTPSRSPARTSERTSPRAF